MTSKVLLERLNGMGEYVKSASSTIETPVVRRYNEKFPTEAPKAEARPRQEGPGHQACSGCCEDRRGRCAGPVRPGGRVRPGRCRGGPQHARRERACPEQVHARAGRSGTGDPGSRRRLGAGRAAAPARRGSGRCARARRTGGPGRP